MAAASVAADASMDTGVPAPSNPQVEGTGRGRVRLAMPFVDGVHLEGYMDWTDITNLALFVVVMVCFAIAYTIVGAAVLYMVRGSASAPASSRKPSRASVAFWPFVVLWILVQSAAHAVVYVCSALVPGRGSKTKTRSRSSRRTRERDMDASGADDSGGDDGEGTGASTGEDGGHRAASDDPHKEE